jgi:hypothetical protein
MSAEWIRDNAVWASHRLIEMAKANRQCGKTTEANQQATYAMNLYVGNVTLIDLEHIAHYFESKD